MGQAPTDPTDPTAKVQRPSVGSAKATLHGPESAAAAGPPGLTGPSGAGPPAKRADLNLGFQQLGFERKNLGTTMIRFG